jgi:hypothetical protein
VGVGNGVGAGVDAGVGVGEGGAIVGPGEDLVFELVLEFLKSCTHPNIFTWSYANPASKINYRSLVSQARPSHWDVCSC